MNKIKQIIYWNGQGLLSVLYKQLPQCTKEEDNWGMEVKFLLTHMWETGERLEGKQRKRKKEDMEDNIYIKIKKER